MTAFPDSVPCFRNRLTVILTAMDRLQHMLSGLQADLAKLISPALRADLPDLLSYLQVRPRPFAP